MGTVSIDTALSNVECDTQQALMVVRCELALELRYLINHKTIHRAQKYLSEEGTRREFFELIRLRRGWSNTKAMCIQKDLSQ